MDYELRYIFCPGNLETIKIVTVRHVSTTSLKSAGPKTYSFSGPLGRKKCQGTLCIPLNRTSWDSKKTVEEDIVGLGGPGI